MLENILLSLPKELNNKLEMGVRAEWMQTAAAVNIGWRFILRAVYIIRKSFLTLPKWKKLKYKNSVKMVFVDIRFYSKSTLQGRSLHAKQCYNSTCMYVLGHGTVVGSLYIRTVYNFVL